MNPRTIASTSGGMWGVVILAASFFSGLYTGCDHVTPWLSEVEWDRHSSA
jgi:hypothetical protein